MSDRPPPATHEDIDQIGAALPWDKGSASGEGRTGTDRRYEGSLRSGRAGPRAGSAAANTHGAVPQRRRWRHRTTVRATLCPPRRRRPPTRPVPPSARRHPRPRLRRLPPPQAPRRGRRARPRRLRARLRTDRRGDGMSRPSTAGRHRYPPTRRLPAAHWGLVIALLVALVVTLGLQSITAGVGRARPSRGASGQPPARPARSETCAGGRASFWGSRHVARPLWSLASTQ